MSELFEKLNYINKVKDNEKRLDKLRSLCVDRDSLNDALEIAKHESTINLSGAILITALSALLITVFSAVLTNLIPNAMDRTILLFILFIIYFAYLWILLKYGFNEWTNLYYDLIDLRKKKREEPDISKLDTTISGVEAINSRIDVIEKNICSKIEAKGKEIMSIKDKNSFNFGFAAFLSVSIFLLTRAIDFVEFKEKESTLLSNGSVKLIILFMIFMLWVFVCWLTFPQEFKEFKELILGKIKAIVRRA